jgi:hypothetical protein
MIRTSDSVSINAAERRALLDEQSGLETKVPGRKGRKFALRAEQNRAWATKNRPTQGRPIKPVKTIEEALYAS